MSSKNLRKKLRGLFHKTPDHAAHSNDNSSKGLAAHANTTAAGTTTTASLGAQIAALKAMDPAANVESAWSRTQVHSGDDIGNNNTPRTGLPPLQSGNDSNDMYTDPLWERSATSQNGSGHRTGMIASEARLRNDREQQQQQQQDANVGMAFTTDDKVEASDMMDPQDTVDTTVHYRQARPVTHETVQHDVHEIREEHIEREIHEYHEIHRIQPVIETEVLPARHFVPVDGGLKEISPDQVDAWVSSQGTEKSWV